MKVPGTLKVQIIKPTASTWMREGARLRVLRRTLASALNRTMTDCYPHAQKQINSFQDGERSKLLSAWQNNVEKLLRTHWNSELTRALAFDSKNRDVDQDIYLPVTEPLTAETIDNIMSQFSGEHMKALYGSKKRFPHFAIGTPFMVRSRAVTISGPAHRARITLPLFGQGSKATEFAVAVSGDGAQAVWDRLVGGIPFRKKLVELEQAWKEISKVRSAAKKAGENIDSFDAELLRIETEISELNVYKLGRVGVAFNERKGKWYANISWSAPEITPVSAGQTAVLIYGHNMHMVALADNGATWVANGTDLLAMKKMYHRRRRSVSMCRQTRGPGARGHGKKRFFAAETRLEGKQARRVDSWIRVATSQLAQWARRHNVRHLVIQDLSGAREDVSADAPKQVKRMMHEWPYFATAAWVTRQCNKLGIECSKKLPLDMCRCPDCDKEDPKNVQDQPGETTETLVHNGKLFERRERHKRFECVACGCKTRLDFAQAASFIKSETGSHSLQDVQTRAGADLEAVVTAAE